MTEPRPPTRDQSLNHPCRIRNVPLNMNRSTWPRSSKGARISSSTVGAKSTLPCNLAFSNTYYKANLAIVQVSRNDRKNWLAHNDFLFHHLTFIISSDSLYLNTKSSPSNSELSNNLLILIFCFEGTFHVAFCFFFAHVVTFVVILFPFADAD